MQDKREIKALTTNGYWTRNYASTKQKIFTLRTDLNLAASELDKYLKRFLPTNKDFLFLEIGCAPGLWMHYFHKNFGYKVEGLEYSHAGCKLTQKNLSALGIESVIYEQDFLANSLDDEKYDVVFSGGFIEHFSQPEYVIEKHLSLLKKGGWLVLEVPNLTGKNLMIQNWLDRKIVNLHNVTLMDREFFLKIAKDFGMEVVDISYVGKMNLCLFIGHRVFLIFLMGLQYLLSKLYFFLHGFSFLRDNKSLSPYIVAVYRKI